MAQLTERPKGSGRWEVRIFLGRDASGKRRFHNKTIKGTKKDALKYATKVQRELDLGTFTEPTAQTLNEYLDRWLVTIAANRAPRTADEYPKVLDRYIRPALGHRRLSQITPLAMQEVYSAMQARGLSPRTVRYAHAVLSSALAQAVKWQELALNPATAVTLPKENKREMAALNAEEAARFLAAAEMDRWGVLFALSLTTGMRPGEVLGLRWQDVDLDRGLVMVRQALVTLGAKTTFGKPKTKGSARTIPIPPSLVKDLRIGAKILAPHEAAVHQHTGAAA